MEEDQYRGSIMGLVRGREGGREREKERERERACSFRSKVFQRWGLGYSHAMNYIDTCYLCCTCMTGSMHTSGHSSAAKMRPEQ